MRSFSFKAEKVLSKKKTNYTRLTFQIISSVIPSSRFCIPILRGNKIIKRSSRGISNELCFDKPSGNRNPRREVREFTVLSERRNNFMYLTRFVIRKRDGTNEVSPRVITISRHRKYSNDALFFPADLMRLIYAAVNFSQTFSFFH